MQSDIIVVVSWGKLCKDDQLLKNGPGTLNAERLPLFTQKQPINCRLFSATANGAL